LVGLDEAWQPRGFEVGPSSTPATFAVVRARVGSVEARDAFASWLELNADALVVDLEAWRGGGAPLWDRVLTTSGYLDPDNPRLLMRRLRRLFSRAMPDHNEINILRGILASFEASRGQR